MLDKCTVGGGQNIFELECGVLQIDRQLEFSSGQGSTMWRINPQTGTKAVRMIILLTKDYDLNDPDTHNDVNNNTVTMQD